MLKKFDALFHIRIYVYSIINMNNSIASRKTKIRQLINVIH
jgi:hypothetical protein